jgi:hypothetical protein
MITKSWNLLAACLFAITLSSLVAMPPDVCSASHRGDALSDGNISKKELGHKMLLH